MATASDEQIADCVAQVIETLSKGYSDKESTFNLGLFLSVFVCSVYKEIQKILGDTAAKFWLKTACNVTNEHIKRNS